MHNYMALKYDLKKFFSTLIISLKYFTVLIQYINY
jgi:hypothetical protein